MAEKENEGRFLKIANILTLTVLLCVAGLLALQSWSLRKELAAVREAVTTPVTPAATPPMVVDSNVPAAAAEVPKRAAATTPTNRNYTQPAPKLAPAVTVPVIAKPDTPPAPVARVVPTDVIPAQPAPYPRYEPPAIRLPEALTATLPAGTVLTVRLLETLSTERNQAGDRYRATLEEPIIIDGNVAVPRGATVEGRIVDVQQAGRVKGVAEMTLELSQLRLSNGETVVLYSSDLRREGETSVGEDTAKVSAGAAIGAAIGAITGGGKGAAVGAATGAGAGTAGVLLSRGKPLVLGPETILSFQLNAPVSFTYRPGQQPDTYSDYAAPRRGPRSDDWDRDRPILRRRR